MKNIAMAILTSVLTVLYCGCQGPADGHNNDVHQDLSYQQDSVSVGGNNSMDYIVKETISANITGADSIVVFSLYSNNEKKSLFSVAIGGNVEYLSDSILSLGNHITALFTFADYSQVDQIFYILSDCDTNTFIQSGRINLPSLGMTMDAVKSLTIDSISVDSIYISGMDIKFATEVLSLDCDSNRIINYYDYQ